MPLYAANVMTSKVITAGPDDTIAHVAQLLARHHISAVPVCAADGALVGMVSEGDLMRSFGTETENRRAWWLRMLAEGTELAPAFLAAVRQDQRHVKDVMTTRVTTVAEGTPLREIADLIVQHRIKRVPVVRDGKVVGIVSRADLVRVIAETPGELSELL